MVVFVFSSLVCVCVPRRGRTAPSPALRVLSEPMLPCTLPHLALWPLRLALCPFLFVPHPVLPRQGYDGLSQRRASKGVSLAVRVATRRRK